MRHDPIPPDAFRTMSVAVPPLAWAAEAVPDRAENARLIRHMEAGGQRLLMYAGNANFYQLCGALHEQVVALIAELAGADSWVIPSAGPTFADLARAGASLRGLRFPAAMLLTAELSVGSGTARAVQHFADAFAGPVILYIRRSGSIAPDAVGRLVAEGALWLVKYGPVAADPARDPYLADLVQAIGADRILSGSGEIVACAHLGRHRLLGFTSGSAALAPSLSIAVRRALGTGDAGAEAAPFAGFEALRNSTHPIIALHEAVALAGLCSTGPILPPLGALEAADRQQVAKAAQALLALERAARAGYRR